jgi:hypothetical protein
MILYGIIIIIVIVIIIYSYIKIKYNFWINQDIHHTYKFWYNFFPGIIDKDLPEREKKYHNFKNIKTLKFTSLQDKTKEKLSLFLENNFLKNELFQYFFKKENIIPYFIGLEGGETFLSIYKKERIDSCELLGTILSYPIQIMIKNNSFNCYYVDYLCVDKNYRNQNIALELMQTHNYNQRYMNKNIVVSLFKREKRLDIAMPLCEISSYLYSIKEIHNENMPNNINLIKVGKNNINIFYNFIKLNYSKFDIFISTSIANLLELINTENIIIYMLIQETQVISVYYFKKTCMYVNERKEIYNCIGSLNCCLIEDIFINGFKNALINIKKDHNDFSYIMIENISDNDKFINLEKKLIITKSFYYFHNLAYKKINANNCLIII